MNITEIARKRLGAVVGEIEYCRMFADDTIKTWRNQVCALSKAARSEPYLCHIAYTRIFQNSWNYFLRPLDNVSDLMNSLEEDFRSFVEVVIGRQNVSDTERYYCPTSWVWRTRDFISVSSMPTTIPLSRFSS